MYKQVAKVGAAIAFFLICGWIAFSVQEASVWHRVTGHRVNAWDAMFLDLGVQASQRPRPMTVEDLQYQLEDLRLQSPKNKRKSPQELLEEVRALNKKP